MEQMARYLHFIVLFAITKHAVHSFEVVISEHSKQQIDR